MNRIFKFNKGNIIRLLLFVGAIMIITYFIPRENDESFNYTMGRPWQYPLLTAPFDIPVNLDSASAAKQRDSINRSFVPIYKRDDKVASSNVKSLTHALEKENYATPALRRQLVETVKSLYDDGIVDNGSYDLIKKGEMPNVRFIIDNVATLTPTDKMMSVRKAYSVIDSIFPMPYAQLVINNV